MVLVYRAFSGLLNPGEKKAGCGVGSCLFVQQPVA